MELRERRTETLKEKIKIVYQSKDFESAKEEAKQKIDNFGMAFFLFMAISLLIECTVYLVPRVYHESRWLLTAVVVFVFCETVVNWHRSYFDVANWVTAATKEKYFQDMQETPSNWKTCLKCQIDAPPRSHHCNHCGKCILKRDHHCFLTGSCIGFYNQKFFVVYCLWVVVGTVFAMFLQLSYLHMDLSLLSMDVFSYIAPVTVHKWVMGYISFGQLLIVLHFYLCTLSFVFSLFFFAWQVLIISQGLTSFEAWKRVLIFHGSSVGENVRSVFGKFINIPILVFVPYNFDQHFDGIQWAMRYKREKGY